MRRVVVGATTQYDPDKALVGSSPFSGDQANTGIVLPASPTVAQNRRYLCRLFGMEVNEDEFVVVHAIHQLLTIGAMYDVGDEQDPTQYTLEVPVTDPTWSFPDGNVSWHLRQKNVAKNSRSLYTDFPFVPPYSANRDGLTSAILARVPVAGAYLPLNGGAPYGEPVSSLGTFKDIRFPWLQVTADLKQRIDGPCQIVMYASVWQTDPDTRVQPPVVADGTYLRQEDRFVMNHDQARYWRIGGRMEVDVYTKTEELARL
jgi:hypothetical protein